VNGLWVNLLAPLTIVKLGWCVMATITLIECLRVYRPLYRVSIIAQAESLDDGLLTWLKVPVKIALGLAGVAGLNLLAGLVSMTLQPPAVQPTLPDSWEQLVPLLIPIFFIVSAMVKMWIASVLRKGYKKVVTGATTLPEKAVALVESL
jgi:hypothetical protein